MGRIHFLTQFVWPDSAPTAIYTEQVAQKLHDVGHDVIMVGGSGAYRPQSRRKAPTAPLKRVPHHIGSRHSLFSVTREYRAVCQAFADYIATDVNPDDTVVVTTAPPNSVTLHAQIHRRKARAVYWLHDYFPELGRCAFHYPRVAQKLLELWWDSHLNRWDSVVKIAGNLGYDAPNSVVIRDWPTIDLGPERPFEKGTALYAGNLGYGHHLPLLLEACGKLRAEGMKVIFRADGPGVRHLPSWIHREALLDDEEKIAAGFWQAQIHLIAADPRYQRAVFPSKFWNCRATGRQIICTGFAGAMTKELDIAQSCDYRQHLDAWVNLAKSLP
jgi:hypothetical protein